MVPDHRGTVIAVAPNEATARAAGAAHLGWKPKNVVVIPLCVEGPEAETAMENLSDEFC